MQITYEFYYRATTRTLIKSPKPSLFSHLYRHSEIFNCETLLQLTNNFTMAAVAERQQMIALLNMCNITIVRQVSFLIDNQGLSSFANIRLLEVSDFDQIASDTSSIRPTVRAFQIGIFRLKCLKALKFWVDDQINQGTAANLIDYTSFTRATRDEYILLAVSARQTALGADEVALPPKFKPTQWISFGRTFDNYLQTKLGVNGIPLNYTIRNPTKAPTNLTAPTLSREQRLIWNAPLTGIAFQTDAKRVMTIAVALMLGTDGYTWIERFIRNHDIQGAWASLRGFYDGPGMITKRVNEARRTVEDSSYHEEATYSFDTHCTKLKGAFETLLDCNEPKSATDKVNILLKSINNNNVQLQSTMALVRQLYAGNFELAASSLSSTVAEQFPANSKKRKAIVSETNNKGKGGMETTMMIGMLAILGFIVTAWMSRQ